MVNQFGITSGGGGGGGGGGVQQIIINLNGIVSQIIAMKLFGVYHVEVSSDVSGSPTFSCDVMKHAAGDAMFVKNVAAIPAADTCAIGISWNPGDWLRISKSLASHNAVYVVTLVGDL